MRQLALSLAPSLGLLLGGLVGPGAATRAAADEGPGAAGTAASPEGGASPASDGPGLPVVAAGLGVAVERPEVVVRHREAHRAAGETGPAAELACEDTAEGLVLCLTVPREPGALDRRFVTRADLAAWGLDSPGARALVRERAAPTEARPERTRVTDMDAWYLLSAEGDGLDHGAWLHPAALADRCEGRGPARVAVPARGVLLAWCGDDGELDRVMAVGVARLHAAAEDGVTARAYQWDPEEARWAVWGQAVR